MPKFSRVLFLWDIRDDPLNNNLICVGFFFNVQLTLIKRFEKSSKFNTFKVHASILAITTSLPRDFSANLIILIKQFHALAHLLPKNILHYFSYCVSADKEN